MRPSHHLSLKLIQRCPACETMFQRAQVTLLSESELTVLAHLSCMNCHVNLLANVVNTPQGLVGNAILVDANVNEIRDYLEQQPMKDDEFLKIYELIHNNKIINNISPPQSSRNQTEDEAAII